MTVDVRAIPFAAFAEHTERLAEILHDCVEGGASVNFVLPYSLVMARQYWSKREAGIKEGEVILFGAFVDGVLLGTVQLVLAQQPNGLHRAEISKMLVHRHARRAGLGRALLEAAETEARQQGRRLLLLDTARDSEGQKLYRACGWSEFGRVDDYALTVHGQPETAVFFTKVLS
jgi:GNAT superfamily N-acetyltransferase